MVVFLLPDPRLHFSSSPACACRRLLRPSHTATLGRSLAPPPPLPEHEPWSVLQNGIQQAPNNVTDAIGQMANTPLVGRPRALRYWMLPAGARLAYIPFEVHPSAFMGNITSLPDSSSTTDAGLCALAAPRLSASVGASTY